MAKEAPVGEAPKTLSIMTIPVTKGKGTVDIDLASIPEAVYAEALRLGLKELVNRGMSKITKAAFPNDEEGMKAAAMAQAAKNVEAINTGNIRFSSGTKSKGISSEVKTEAMRLAKALVKDSLKRDGMKISHIPASEITAAAKDVLEAHPSLIAQAEANIAERKATTIKVDVTKLVKVDPALVAKAEEKKAKTKAAGQLSAKQAGKVAPRGKKGKVAQATA